MANSSNKKKVKGVATKSKGRKTGASGILTQTAEKKKKELTADEMLLRAWKKTYENRDKRING